MKFIPEFLSKIKLDKATLIKMAKSAGLLAAGAALTYLADNLLLFIGAVGIPDGYKPLALATFTWVINSIREWIKQQKQKAS